MDMIKRYGSPCPAIIDNEIFRQLTPKQQNYIEKFDYFLHYDGNNNMVLATFDFITRYETIEELKEGIDNEISLGSLRKG